MEHMGYLSIYIYRIIYIDVCIIHSFVFGISARSTRHFFWSQQDIFVDDLSYLDTFCLRLVYPLIPKDFGVSCGSHSNGKQLRHIACSDVQKSVYGWLDKPFVPLIFPWYPHQTLFPRPFKPVYFSCVQFTNPCLDVWIPHPDMFHPGTPSILLFPIYHRSFYIPMIIPLLLVLDPIPSGKLT